MLKGKVTLRVKDEKVTLDVLKLNDQTSKEDVTKLPMEKSIETETKTFKPSFGELHEPHPNEKIKIWKPYYKRHRTKTNWTNPSPSSKIHAKIEQKPTLTHEGVQLRKRGQDGYHTCGWEDNP